MELSSPNFLSDLMDITVLFDMVNKPYCIINCRAQGILTKYSIRICLKISNLRDLSWTVCSVLGFLSESKCLSHINIKQKNKICTRPWVNSWKCQFGKTVIRYVFICMKHLLEQVHKKFQQVFLMNSFLSYSIK